MIHVYKICWLFCCFYFCIGLPGYTVGSTITCVEQGTSTNVDIENCNIATKPTSTSSLVKQKQLWFTMKIIHIQMIQINIANYCQVSLFHYFLYFNQLNVTVTISNIRAKIKWSQLNLFIYLLFFSNLFFFLRCVRVDLVQELGMLVIKLEIVLFVYISQFVCFSTEFVFEIFQNIEIKVRIHFYIFIFYFCSCVLI
jgi:hypothetical protein